MKPQIYRCEICGWEGESPFRGEYIHPQYAGILLCRACSAGEVVPKVDKKEQLEFESYFDSIRKAKPVEEKKVEEKKEEPKETKKEKDDLDDWKIPDWFYQE